MKSPLRNILIFVIILTLGPHTLPAQKRAREKTPGTSQDRRLASINGKAVTESQARAESAEELETLELQVLRSKAEAARNEHEIIEEATNRLIRERLLQAEAQKQGISKETLLAKEIERKMSDPAPEEIEAFYQENKQRITKPKEQAEAQISKYLKQRKETELRKAFFDKLEREYNVTRDIKPLRYNVGLADRPSRGQASAPVQLVVFSDFQCPYCKRFDATVKEVLKKYGDQVGLIFRHLPLTNIHPNAQKAAEASLCAEAQGRFWEMHDLLFQNPESLRDEDLKARASKLGLDKPAFDTCLDSSRFKGKVKEDLRAASMAGLEGTPALFVNGRLLYGSHPYEDIAEIIDEELKQQK